MSQLTFPAGRSLGSFQFLGISCKEHSCKRPLVHIHRRYPWVIIWFGNHMVGAELGFEPWSFILSAMTMYHCPLLLPIVKKSPEVMEFWLFWLKLGELVLWDVRRQKSVSSSPVCCCHNLTTLHQTLEFLPARQSILFSADTDWLSYDFIQSAWKWHQMPQDQRLVPQARSSCSTTHTQRHTHTHLSDDRWAPRLPRTSVKLDYNMEPLTTSSSDLIISYLILSSCGLE